MNSWADVFPPIMAWPCYANRPVAQIPHYTSAISRAHVHISVTEWCIVGYLSNALWDYLDGSIEALTSCIIWSSTGFLPIQDGRLLTIIQSYIVNLSHQPVIGLIVGLHPDNERRRYFVTTPLIGWAQPIISPAVMSVSRFSPSMYAGKCSFVLKSVEGWYLIHHLNTHQANSDIEWLRFLQWHPMVVTMFDKSIFINSIHTVGSKYQINNANYFRCLISILYSVPQAYLLLPWWTLDDHQTLRMKRS